MTMVPQWLPSTPQRRGGGDSSNLPDTPPSGHCQGFALCKQCYSGCGPCCSFLCIWILLQDGLPGVTSSCHGMNTFTALDKYSQVVFQKVSCQVIRPPAVRLSFYCFLVSLGCFSPLIFNLISNKQQLIFHLQVNKFECFCPHTCLLVAFNVVSPHLRALCVYMLDPSEGVISTQYCKNRAPQVCTVGYTAAP